MILHVLGCSGSIAAGCRTTAFLLDGDVLIDAGTGVGDLPLEALARIDHILISHSHLDHVLAIGLLADSVLRVRAAAGRSPIRVHGLPETLAALRAHIFNGVIWPDFTRLPSADHPVLELVPFAVGDVLDLAGKRIEVLSAAHTVPAVGFAVALPPGPDGGSPAAPGTTAHLAPALADGTAAVVAAVTTAVTAAVSTAVSTPGNTGHAALRSGRSDRPDAGDTVPTLLTEIADADADADADAVAATAAAFTEPAAPTPPTPPTPSPATRWWVYTGDTGPNPLLWQRLRHMAVAHLVIETAFSDEERQIARISRHLCPAALGHGLQQLGGAVDVHITHIKPGEIEAVMAQIGRLGSAHRIHALSTGQVMQLA